MPLPIKTQHYEDSNSKYGKWKNTKRPTASMRDAVYREKQQAITASSSDCCCCACLCERALCSTAVKRRFPIDANGARSAVHAWGVLCGVPLARPHAPEPRALQLSLLMARVCSRNKQHTKQPRTSMLQQQAVDKTSGAVIDAASAPYRPSATYGHTTCRPSRRSRLTGYASWAMP